MPGLSWCSAIKDQCLTGGGDQLTLEQALGPSHSPLCIGAWFMVNGPRILAHRLSYWVLVFSDFLVVCSLMLTCSCLFLSAFLTVHAGDSPRSWFRFLWAHPWEGEHKALFLLLLGRSRHCRSLSKQKVAWVPRQAPCRISHLTVHRG